MKLILSFFLSVVIFAASFQTSLLFIDYQINRDFYEIHCINKQKPELQCHGKCQMKKESEKTTTTFSLVKYGFEFNIKPEPPFEFAVKCVPLADFNGGLISYRSTFLEETFLKVLPHPPQFSLFFLS